MSQPAQIDPFHAIGISTLAHKLKAEGASIIHMEFGQPSTGAPGAAIAVAHEMLDADRGGYWESAPLRARIARHYLETYGVSVAPERIILTCGASPALVLALASVFNPGDRIALAEKIHEAHVSKPSPRIARFAGCSSPLRKRRGLSAFGRPCGAHAGISSAAAVSTWRWTSGCPGPCPA